MPFNATLLLSSVTVITIIRVRVIATTRLIEGLPVTVGAELHSWNTMNEPYYDYHWIRPWWGDTPNRTLHCSPTPGELAGIRSSCTGNIPPRFAIFARPYYPRKGLNRINVYIIYIYIKFYSYYLHYYLSLLILNFSIL